ALHIDILSQVLAGLHHFHELKDVDENPLNPVHRDVSPQNVLILHDGVAKVLDFGIAKVTMTSDDHTRAGLIKGKIHYMPPEQLAGDAEIDRRADVFAVGVMLWEALAGRRMWQGMSSQHVVRALARGELPQIADAAPGVPSELEAIVTRALQPERSARFDTAEEMQRALEQALAKTFGPIRRRELAAFMHQHFGEYRQAQQRRVDEARRNPIVDSSVTEVLTSSVRPLSAPPENLPTSTALVQPPPRRSRWLVAAAAGLMLAGASMGAVLALRSAGPQRATVEAAPSVHFQILVEPAEAEILLDGVRLGVEKYAGKRPRSTTSHELLIRAPGYRARQEVVRFDDDVLRLVRLDPIDSDSEPVEPAKAPPDARASVRTERAPVPPRAGRSRPVERNAGAVPSTTSSALADDVESREVDPGQEDPSALAGEAEAGEADQEPAPAASAVAPVGPSAPPVAVTPPPQPTPGAVAPRPSEPKVEKPRLVVSKVGHARLAVNTSQDPYRPRLPKAMQHLDRSFETSVAICVSAAGNVTSVKIIDSADPAIDRPVSSTIARWRYQPMMENGRAVPFCYPLRIQLTGG
ncbi:MAG TPA: protein kinase, partial [Polyangiaceae bacterium]